MTGRTGELGPTEEHTVAAALGGGIAAAIGRMAAAGRDPARIAVRRMVEDLTKVAILLIHGARGWRSERTTCRALLQKRHCLIPTCRHNSDFILPETTGESDFFCSWRLTA